MIDLQSAKRFANKWFTVVHGRGGAWGILGISLLLTYLAWSLTNQHIAKRHQDRFSFRTQQVRDRIEERMLEYEQALRGGVGLFKASSDVSRSEWRDYVKQCEIQRYFPGIQAMAVAVPISPNEKLGHEYSIKAEGFPDYKISPPGTRDVYSSIIFIEPFDWRNRRAFGFDMYSEPNRRKAMDRAIETGLPSISSKITLVQETDEDVQAGILCYLPVYENGANPTTVSERKRAHRAWVYAAFRCDDLLEGIVGDDLTTVELQVYDSSDEAPEHLLFQTNLSESVSGNSPMNRLSATMPVHVSGRDWTLRMRAGADFVENDESWVSLVVAFGGLLIDVLLFAVIYSIGRQREVAQGMARRMTNELRDSEIRNRSIVENASEAILSVTETGMILAANEASRTVFRSHSALLGMDFDRLLVSKGFEILVGDWERLGPNSRFDVQCRRIDGSEFRCRISIGKVPFGDKTNYIVIAQDETERVEAESKIHEINKQLVESSRQAGMAEVATGVLHNVGNILNSVNVSANLLKQRISTGQIDRLENAAAIIEENAGDLATFLALDERGKHFPKFIKSLSESFKTDRQLQMDEINALTKNVDHIKEIVSMQQSFATKSGMTELIDPRELIDDAIRINDFGEIGSRVDIIREFDDVPMIQLQRHDFMQIAVNLIKNAMQATEQSDASEKVVRVRVKRENDFVRIDVTDNGVGIAKKNLTSIFQHGFTTKKNGHGFGLHSSANAAREMGGSLSVESEGLGLGATFTLRLPVQTSCVKLQTSISFDDSDPSKTLDSAIESLGVVATMD